MPKADDKENRRDFFRGCARNALLGVIALASTALGIRKPSTMPLQQRCVGNGVCRGCPAFTDCGLPQALSAKRAMSAEGQPSPSGQPKVPQ
ncbi:MAG: hypothetical protein J7M19_06810 [Planctomycetes bacterium]|nr:hypothetical protein [Planctomycetota bacterium]